MTREEKIKAFEMRMDGATFQEIADAFGVSKQWICQSLYTKARTPKTFECIFPGLKRWLESKEYSVSQFNVESAICNYANTLRRKLNGEFDFTLPEIKKILAFTGLTFEEAFGEGVDLDGGSDG